MTAVSGITSESAPERWFRRVVGRVLETAVIAVVVLADTLAFNQLSTQSPIDGIIQLSVVGVGMAGAVQVLALLVAPGHPRNRLLAPVVAVLSVAALVGWRAQWPIGWAVLACAGSALVWFVLGSRAWSVPRGASATARAEGPVTVLQAGIYLWFAVLVAVDARHVLFG